MYEVVARTLLGEGGAVFVHIFSCAQPISFDHFEEKSLMSKTEYVNKHTPIKVLRIDLLL